MKRSLETIGIATVVAGTLLASGCAEAGSPRSPEAQKSQRPVATKTVKAIGHASCSQDLPPLHGLSSQELKVLDDAAKRSGPAFEGAYTKISGVPVHCLITDYTVYYKNDADAATARNLATALGNDYTNIHIQGAAEQRTDNGLILHAAGN